MILRVKIPFIFRHSGFKKYFLNSSWLVGEKLIRLISGLFVGIYIARYLGPANYGILNYVISFVAMIAIISSLGLDETSVNELLSYPKEINIILGTVFRLKYIGVFITLLLIISTFLFHFNDEKTNIYILIISLSYLFQPFYVIDFYFQSQVKAKYLVQANIIGLIINSILRLFLVFMHASLVYFVFISILDTFIVALSLVLFYLKLNFSISNWKFDNSLAKKLLSKSWPLMLSGVVAMVYMRIDQIMLKEMIGFDAVGIYSAAIRISELWYFIPIAICNSFFPALVNSKIMNQRLFLNRMQGLLNILVAISLSISIFVTIFSTKIISILYGSHYYESALILTMHIWTGIFVFIGVASGKYLIIENLTRISFYRSFFGAIANILLNLVLIPKIGILGAAISTLVAQIIAAYIFDFFNTKTRELFYLKSKALLFIGFKQNFLKLFYEH
jgi:O-antigen/teichoic acid export membrane protein